jgi:hypothetical protein
MASQTMNESRTATRAILVAVALVLGCSAGCNRRDRYRPERGGAAGAGVAITGGVGGRFGPGGSSGSGEGGRRENHVPDPDCTLHEGDACSTPGATELCCDAVCSWTEGTPGGVQPYLQRFACLRYGSELRWHSCGISQAPVSCGDLSNVDVCAMPGGVSEPVDCATGSERFWHDADSGRCESYTSCFLDGAANSFETREQCEATCSVAADGDDDASVPASPGDEDAAAPMPAMRISSR